MCPTVRRGGLGRDGDRGSVFVLRLRVPCGCRDCDEAIRSFGRRYGLPWRDDAAADAWWPVSGNARARILVLDEDPTVAEVVARYLERDGHEVVCAGDGVEALRRALTEPPDLLVLDPMPSTLEGLWVCRRLRERRPTPVIMMIGPDELDRVISLEVGADDYVTKPFSPRELVLRVQAMLRRARGVPVTAGTGVLRDGDLVVDVGAHEVRLGDRPVALTDREFDLLAHL